MAVKKTKKKIEVKNAKPRVEKAKAAPAAMPAEESESVRFSKMHPLPEQEGPRETTDYGTCPVCRRPMQVLGGFTCDWCGLGVCEHCIKKYEGSGKYICLSCASKLPRAEQLKITGAEDLTDPQPTAIGRTFKWWITLALIALPVFLGGAWWLYAAGLQIEAVGLIIVLIALLLYWNEESQKWLGTAT
ncbi:MAG: hypothetical protein Q7T16_04715 [Candidatus Burarchaeum sp.]|nr:hypothetical protein [Candidatus Burarchaeum sp.]MDO8339931.1 hypothetical protein [Candidatus Burarchaeum sp.]